VILADVILRNLFIKMRFLSHTLSLFLISLFINYFNFAFCKNLTFLLNDFEDIDFSILFLIFIFIVLDACPAFPIFLDFLITFLVCLTLSLLYLFNAASTSFSFNKLVK